MTSTTPTVAEDIEPYLRLGAPTRPPLLPAGEHDGPEAVGVATAGVPRRRS